MTMTTATAEATQVYQLFIKASPDAIWQALLDPEFTEQYFHGTRFDSMTYEAGAPFVSRIAADGRVAVEGTILEFDPPRRFVHTWRAMYADGLADETPSRVSWEIEAQDQGYCKVTVVHDQLEGAPKTAESVSGDGWMYVLSGLKTLLETGSPLA
jgi:uncharacterized protein YndB with AHSA1/START domain